MSATEGPPNGCEAHRPGAVKYLRLARNSLPLRAGGVGAEGDGGGVSSGLGYLQTTARERKNIFAALMEAVKTHSLGQISHALYEVGGEYRRNM